MYVGHSDGERYQPLREHLENVANLTGKFAAEFRAAKLGKFLGWYHDIGKYSHGFQKRILENGPRVDHSTAGAIELAGKNLSLLSFCVAGHHGGLPNLGSKMDPEDKRSLYGKLKRKLIGKNDYSSFKSEVPEFSFGLEQPDIDQMDDRHFGQAFFIRMLFSCLVDADFLDTEAFMSNKGQGRGGFSSIDDLMGRLNRHIESFWPPKNELNKKRCDILQNCIDRAASDEGLYTLTVPTGGGKTIASLAFALNQAVKYRKKRIIYVIPYTSIIEQNAQIFRDIIGDENIIEHHMNVIYDDKEEDISKKPNKKLATENWDAPIIVTTNVQFFESLYAHKPSRCRKLHNIANSIIIFDEAQMFPVPYLQPCVRAIAELVRNYGVTAILCSATQPALSPFFPNVMKAKEICSNVTNLFLFFKRTKIEKLGNLGQEELAAKLNDHKQVLCIVNLKKSAQELFGKLKGQNIFHLSTFMYPEHRKRSLEKIRQCLKNNEECRVVSTSLIEAGVDVDFPAVYREMTGIDSIIQAAGRCNREGKRPREESRVYIFQLVDEDGKIRRGGPRMEKETAQIVARDFEDISSVEAIHSYFEQLYHFKGSGLDKREIIKQMDDGTFPFEDVSREFVMIEENTKAVFIPFEEEAREIEIRIRKGERNRNLMRRMGRYVVNVRSSEGKGSYQGDFEKLYESCKLEIVDENIAILLDPDLYEMETIGLMIREEAGGGIFA